MGVGMNMKFGVGQSIVRKEDDNLIRGKGRYTGDHAPAGLLHAVIVRSPHAHATFKIDATAAKAAPGVALVLTGADVAALAGLPCLFNFPDQPFKAPDYPILAKDEVRHVGDAFAFVVAQTVEQARDAAELLEIDWQTLPSVTGVSAAVASGAPLVWPAIPGNILYDRPIGDKAKVDAIFAKAHAVAEVRIVNQRLVTNYMETRGVVAEYDAAQDHLTVTLGSQGSHRQRDVLCQVLGLPKEKVRIITPDVGGGFGTKIFPYREYALAAFAARTLKTNVKWVADRADHFLGDSHGRDNVTHARMALDADGKFLAMDVDMLADMGAYLSMFGPYIPFGGAGMLPGVYDIPAFHCRVRAVVTNSVPVDAYRGAGRPEAAYVIERLVDACARTMNMTPDAVRKKNFIPPKAMPYTTQTGKVYDTGEFAAHLKIAQDKIDWKGFPRRAKEAKRHGFIRGIGMASYVEVCGSVGPETAVVRLGDDGNVTVLIGSQSTGQGHQTAYAQLVSEQFGVPLDRVTVIQGDTAQIATGAGTGGSSSIPVGGVSVQRATKKLGENLKELAATALEASAADIEIGDGVLRIAGTDRTISFADLARKGDAEQLSASEKFGPKAGTYPNGTHIVEVEIDPALGTTRIVNYVIVDDFGVTLNPLLLAGQIHGGAVQGIGQALMEQAVYDPDDGQLVTGTLMDYALPRAEDVPDFSFETHNVPCATNPLGVKGAGEAGTIGAAPAVMNAVVDALWREYHIDSIDMPATPQRIWSTIREHARRHSL